MGAAPAVSKRLGEANLLWEFLAGKRKTLKLEREGNEAVLGAFWGLVAEKMKGGGKSSHARRELHSKDKRRTEKTAPQALEPAPKGAARNRVPEPGSPARPGVGRDGVGEGRHTLAHSGASKGAEGDRAAGTVGYK